MKLVEHIKSLILEGKSEAEIASSVIDFKVEGKSVSTDEIADAFISAKKSHEVEEALKVKLAQKEAAELEAKRAKEADEKIEARIEEKLKSIDIKLSNFKPEKSLKRFNHHTGQIETIETPSESYGQMNLLLKAMSDKDMKSAQSISNEIEQDNAKKSLETKAPTVSDVTTRGSFAIPTEVNMVITQLTQAKSIMLPLVNQDNVVFQSKVYPVMYGITVDYIADQSTAASEVNPTFTNPTVNMKRLGAWSSISNTILRQKGADLVSAFMAAYSSALAKKLDQQIAVGNVTTNSDLVDGIVFDALTSFPTAIARTSLTLSTMGDLLYNTLSADADVASCVFLAGSRVYNQIGMFETTGGLREFPQYVNGGKVAPFGTPLIRNQHIPSTLDVGGDARTGGTDDVLILADMSKVVVGITGEARIDTSTDFLFTSDAMVIRVIKDYGMKVLSGSSTAGVVAIAQELTN